MNHQEHQIILDSLEQKYDRMDKMILGSLLGQNEIIRYLLVMVVINFLMVGILGFILSSILSSTHVSQNVGPVDDVL